MTFSIQQLATCLKKISPSGVAHQRSDWVKKDKEKTDILVAVYSQD